QASNRSGGGAVIYAPSGSQEVLTEVLKDTLRIAPTIVKRNGDRIQVLVARDVDFRSVYELRATTTGRCRFLPCAGLRGAGAGAGGRQRAFRAGPHPTRVASPARRPRGDRAVYQPAT